MEDQIQKSNRFKPIFWIGLVILLLGISWFFSLYSNNSGGEGLGLGIFLVLPIAVGVVLLGLILMAGGFAQATLEHPKGAISNKHGGLMIFFAVLLIAGVAYWRINLYQSESNEFRSRALSQLPMPINIEQYQIDQAHKKAKANAESQIAVTFPNGGETLIKGKTYTITWKIGPTFKYSQVDIFWSNSETQQPILPWGERSRIIPNTGSYQWTIPDEQYSGYANDGLGVLRKVNLNDNIGYKIGIRGHSTDGMAPYDRSDQPFYIVSQ